MGAYKNSVRRFSSDRTPENYVWTLPSYQLHYDFSSPLPANMTVEGINTDSEQIMVPSTALRQMLCSIFTAKTKQYLQKVFNKVMLFYWQKPRNQNT